MKILLTGGTGFIGTALCARLLAEQHRLVVLTRHPETVKAPMRGVADLCQLGEEAGFDVVINLAGEPIANRRWSAAQRQRIPPRQAETPRVIGRLA